MRNPKFQEILPNYRKRVLEITLLEGRRKSRYQLPFAVFNGRRIGAANRFKDLIIDQTLRAHAVRFTLEDGSMGDFPADFVLYHCDPTYDWSPLNQLKRALRGELSASGLSIRVIADAIKTSPAQVIRLLKDNQGARQLTQLFQIAELAGCRIELKLKKKGVA